jgi:hypothetical protein
MQCERIDFITRPFGTILSSGVLGFATAKPKLEVANTAMGYFLHGTS